MARLELVDLRQNGAAEIHQPISWGAVQHTFLKGREGFEVFSLGQSHQDALVAHLLQGLLHCSFVNACDAQKRRHDSLRDEGAHSRVWSKQRDKNARREVNMDSDDSGH